ncbi:uncharacterized protein LOC141651883 [Silene latifolia]|uniref:uncharacterized protein LOC141651883 n=1 Tax=Silene latifolia TaxID=37657 RepID=UPI003D77D607
MSILRFSHEYACGGNFEAKKTARKVLESGFFWPTLFRDAHAMVKTCDRCQRVAGLHRKLQLQELEEIRNDAYENASIYKARTRAWHDNMISRRVFQVGEKVLLFQNRLRLFSGKLRSRWMGPYEVVKVFQHGAIEIKCLKSGKVLKVNGQRLKHYHEGIEVGEVETLHLVDPIYSN